jgi:hypothetical protein
MCIKYNVPDSIDFKLPNENDDSDSDDNLEFDDENIATRPAAVRIRNSLMTIVVNNSF